MSDDYLWNRGGTPDLDIKRLEELLEPLGCDVPLDELRLAKGRRSEPVRATAHEPIETDHVKTRAKGKMNIFDKRIVGAATLCAAGLGLLGVGAYARRVTSPGPPPYRPPMIELAPSFAMAPHAPPVVATTDADLAITAGESAKIHVPFGAVDVEIQSNCNAEVEMSEVTAIGSQSARIGDPPPQALSAMMHRLTGEHLPIYPSPASRSGALGGDRIIAGTTSADGRVSRYRLAPDIGPFGMVQYTARCIGKPPTHGVLEIDREDGRRPIGPITNARVFDDANELTSEEYVLAHGIHVFGSVLPGARVSIAGENLYLEPVQPSTQDDPIVGEEFRHFAKTSPDHPVVAVRVDDVHGTQFYVSHRVLAGTGVGACTDAMTEPKKTAARLAGRGDHPGALHAIETVIAACNPDRETLSLALRYACEAGDADAARTYWRKLPGELRGMLESMCAAHSITRAQLDAH